MYTCLLNKLNVFFSQVARHLSKLFDNMAALKFRQDDEGEELKEAVGMYSKEKEYVDFDKICDCKGQVNIQYSVHS